MKYTWSKAQGTDVSDIVSITQQQVEHEANTIWRTDPHVFAYNVAMTVVTQMYNPWGALLMVGKDDVGKIIAYFWAMRGEHTVWSSDEMVTIRLVHVDQGLPVKDRIRLIQDMIALWEVWAIEIKAPVICSSTVRNDQAGFLHIHERQGYVIRGSTAYKRFGSLD
jgi:hypothetical protein